MFEELYGKLIFLSRLKVKLLKLWQPASALSIYCKFAQILFDLKMFRASRVPDFLQISNLDFETQSVASLMRIWRQANAAFLLHGRFTAMPTFRHRGSTFQKTLLPRAISTNPAAHCVTLRTQKKSFVMTLTEETQTGCVEIRDRTREREVLLKWEKFCSSHMDH